MWYNTGKAMFACDLLDAREGVEYMMIRKDRLWLFIEVAAASPPPTFSLRATRSLNRFTFTSFPVTRPRSSICLLD